MRRTRPSPSRQHEHNLWQQGYKAVAGLDEVGRGAWAGPLVVGAVILPQECDLPGLADSKLLSAKAREKLVPMIQSQAIAWSLGIVPVEELDAVGLALSLRLAMLRAVESLSVQPDYLLTDGASAFRVMNIPETPTVSGDQLISCIAAASVIAKVARDQMMRDLHEAAENCSYYRFDLNKGYPSAEHRAALGEHGASVHHRRSFAPIKLLFNQVA